MGENMGKSVTSHLIVFHTIKQNIILRSNTADSKSKQNTRGIKISSTVLHT